MNFHPLLWAIFLEACHLTRAKYNHYESPPTLKCPKTKPPVFCPYLITDECQRFCDTLLSYEDTVRTGNRTCQQISPIRNCPYNNGLDCMSFCSNKEDGKKGPPIKAYLYSAYDQSLKVSIEFTQVGTERINANVRRIKAIPNEYSYVVMMLYPPENVNFGCRITGPPLYYEEKPIIIYQGSLDTDTYQRNLQVNIPGVLKRLYTNSILDAIVVFFSTSWDSPHPYPLACGKILADGSQNEYLSAWRKGNNDENMRMSSPPPNLPLLTNTVLKMDAITDLHRPSDGRYVASIVYKIIDEHSVELLLIPSNNQWLSPMYLVEIWNAGDVYPGCVRTGAARKTYFNGTLHKQVADLTMITGFNKPIFGTTSHLLSLNPASWYYIMDYAVVVYALDSEPENLDDVVTPANPFACGYVKPDDGRKNEFLMMTPTEIPRKTFTEGGYFLESVMAKIQ